MTISEFAERYNLHDSFIEHAEYAEQRRKVILRICCALWMQQDYSEGTPETGSLTVTFRGVTSYSCNTDEPDGEFVGILRTTVNGEHTFEMVLLDEATDEIYEMRIAADDIDAVVDIP